jgi:hypothetical protein
MKPIIILPKGQVSATDIKRLRDNGLCVIEAVDPSLVRFTEPPITGKPVLEKAALELSQRLLNGDRFQCVDQNWVRALYAWYATKGTSLDFPKPITATKKAARNE